MKITEKRLLKNIESILPFLEDYLNSSEEYKAKRYHKSTTKISIPKLINLITEHKLSVGDLLMHTNINLEKFLWILMTGKVNHHELKRLTEIYNLFSKMGNGK